jgi:hypothetical protein
MEKPAIIMAGFFCFKTVFMSDPIIKRDVPRADIIERQARAEIELQAERPGLEVNESSTKVASEPKRDEAAELEHLQALRQGPLANVTPPAAPVSDKGIEEIKRLLFPNIDLTQATPQQLVTYLLVNHSMEVGRAHEWVEFLAENQHVISSMEAA